MYMAYTTNPHLPKLRMQAAKLVLEQGWSTREVARYTGFNQSSIVRWVEKARTTNLRLISTESARPHSHPRSIPREVEQRILELRKERNQCAEILHWRLQKEGVRVSLSSVKRTLKRSGISRFSKWKKWHTYAPRPAPEKPGILVQIDTIHDGTHSYENPLYIYTLLDVCSRWAYAWPVERISTHTSLAFVRRAQTASPFLFSTLQSDHGPEFSKYFTTQISASGLVHRHSRVRTPNDNAHLERFNRTIQEEYLHHIPRSLKSWQKEIPAYLRYYNDERPHMGLNMLSPLQVMQRY